MSMERVRSPYAERWFYRMRESLARLSVRETMSTRGVFKAFAEERRSP